MTDGERLIDTNVLVHAYVLLDARKQASAREITLTIWRDGGGLTTLQNLCEFFAVATKRIARPMRVERAQNIVKQIISSRRWRVLDRREATVLHGIELVKLHRLPFWDALIAACMLENGIDIIVTENERDFKRLPGITVINPFKQRVKR